jgi:hypothetical protein
MRLKLRWSALAILFAALLLGTGCSGKQNDHKDSDSENDEHEKGPHGGVVVDWGKNHEYHLEFLPNHKTKTATVYVLDRKVKNAVPIPVESITLTITNVKPPVQITLKAEPQEGDPQGKASRFSGKHDQIGVEMDFKGEISGKIADKPYSGTFDEKDHDHK